ncbi:MAG: family 16 glycosylhydrolase [Phycisphaerales bacterium]|nr:family 16 glycosylhydrolase [Phycisphaerales bacterium]
MVCHPLTRLVRIGLIPILTTTFGLPAAAATTDLVANGSFENSLSNWTTSGDASVVAGGWNGSQYLQLVPTADVSAEAWQRIEGLAPRTRYTVAARVQTDDHLAPPIVGLRNGPQIAKASGWVAIDEENRWVERRFEVFTDDGQTSLDVYLQAWKTDIGATIRVDDVRLYQGRIDPPVADPGDPPFPGPPAFSTVPSPGENIVINGDLSDETGNPWSLGIEASIENIDGAAAIQLVSTADTSRASQVPGLALPPGRSWILTAEAKVDPGVISNIYLTGTNEFFANVAIDATDWTTIELPFTTKEDWVGNVKLTLENWKNQPGAAWFRNIRWEATGEEWSPTTDAVPVPQTETLDENFSSGLDMDDWLISTKAWGGDNGGVSPLNVSIVDDIDNGQPIKALRLQANGDLYTGDTVHYGRKTRVGSAIATRQYFASGRYEVRARVAPELGAVTAFWPFHYIDYQKGEAGYWHEPNPRRNTEIDWEFPTDLMGTGQDQAAEYGLDASDIAFTNARTNSWGGQFGGEGGEHKGRRVMHDAEGNIVDLAQDSLDGKYHTYTIEWHSGSDLGDDGDTRDEIGCVRWYFDDLLIDELWDVEFGQGNVPFRAARFWIGVWFAAAGYGDEVGWGGSPDFDSTALYIASVKIEPFLEPRDTWVRETVPNIEWAMPDQYPAGPATPECPADLDGNGNVGATDVLILLAGWGTADGDVTGDGLTDVQDVLALIDAWGNCPT